MNRPGGCSDNQRVSELPHRVGREGQAAVETAIILPLMVFMVLGIMQLTMVQQAELMTEYAAYQACRAGIVWNANRDKMEDAARVALAPTIGKSNLYTTATVIRDGPQGMVDLAQNIASLYVLDHAGAALLNMPLVRADIIHPTKGEFSAVDSKSPVPGNQELFFDDVGGANTGDGFYADEGYRKTLLLTVRLRYLYELRIPFADWVIQTCFFAANAPRLVLSGALGEEEASPTHALSATQSGDEDQAALLTAGTANAIDLGNGLPIMSKADFLKLYGLRKVHGGIYLIPLTASYTMRMQSNVYYDNLNH